MRKKTKELLMWLLTVFVVAVCVAVAVTLKENAEKAAASAKTTVATAKAVAAEAATTEAARTLAAAADGQSDSLLCKASYSDEEAADPDTVVATLGSQSLTVGELQVYYYWAITGYDGEEAPDYTQPLDEQLCPVAETEMSWQHYFLSLALSAWESQARLVEAAAQPQLITEEAYVYRAEFREKYLPDDTKENYPALKYLYEDKDCYTPNSVHQAYLDSLSELTETAQTAAAASARTEDVVAAAENMNLAYMYLTEKTWEEAIDAYPEADSVSIRQCLLLPEGAVVAEDGTVTASEKAWEACRIQAKTLYSTWKESWLTNRSAEGHFGRIANENSDESASAPVGGLYVSIHEGELPDEIDAWCFDSAREVGDVEIIRTDYGYHIVYFCGRTTQDEALDAAQALADAAEALTQDITDECTVDYSVITLTKVAPSEPDAEALLYADVGFERFPEAILYFQTDYSQTRYGSYSIASGGCGITTFAMLATYMTDSLLTPAMMAEQFAAYYAINAGTDGNIFINAPETLGFYADTHTSSLDEVIEALENGQLVVTLQRLGVFTSGGHYMLLTEYHEEDDTFSLRDSNIYNYPKLSGFTVDRFTRSEILSGAQGYYIAQEKVVTIDTCTRCGSGEGIASDYVCQKCLAAIARRTLFLENYM